MKKISSVLTASMILFPILSFAQTSPQPPAAWVAFQKEESVKQAAFMQQIKNDRKNFLKYHPEVKRYFAEMSTAGKERIAAWKAAHQKI